MILKVLDKRQETKDIFSLILEKPKGFNFYPGQYLDIELLADDPSGNVRAFTISSSPTEDYLMITTNKGVTSFKKFLEKLKAGDQINASHPAGTFTLDETEEAVFLAGGVGITPFRSMLKYALDQKLSTPITLIYSNSDNNFLFKKELNLWQKQYPSLTIHYVVTGRDGRLDQEKFSPITDSIYYLAGPPKMVDDFENMLLILGVDSTNIRTDRFDGY